VRQLTITDQARRGKCLDPQDSEIQIKSRETKVAGKTHIRSVMERRVDGLINRSAIRGGRWRKAGNGNRSFFSTRVLL
jgi:hypothetical protein